MKNRRSPSDYFLKSLFVFSMRQFFFGHFSNFLVKRPS
nr:MAG TPA: hypothetical protein [Caudoviricetes sp.]